MNEVIDLNQLVPGGVGQLDLLQTLFAFTLCILMSFVVRAFYIQRSFSLTGKTHIGAILPILSAVVFLVIIVVKSSLALSLGLVGALSIVRFRTPIKEPEELVYLFLAIAIGLGYGAGQILITTVLVSAIILIVFLWLSNHKIAKTSEYNCVIRWINTSLSLDEITEKLADSVLSMKLVRLDRGKDNNTAVLLIVPKQDVSFDTIMNVLQTMDENLTLSFFEAKTNW